MPPSSGRMNLVSVVSGMTGRRECVHYVALLGTLLWNVLIHFSYLIQFIAGPIGRAF
jgi:hypothetical protein